MASVRSMYRVAARPVALFRSQGFTMATRSMTTLDDRRRLLEDQYFKKEDERLMRQLLAKMKKQSDLADSHGAEGSRATERSALNDIVSKYKMSTEDIDALIAWRHDHSF
eukprot:TRINITY_DN22549_c0_g1_i1.p1 TRINITY_DN22549_c0_g1~~TRINITY_DN22549_c0_g1_i1.p1  ORF type:complete len:122 (-),score=19.90 TRINITY_DN22549_c0_g1_i1:440-769(-)